MSNSFKKENFSILANSFSRAVEFGNKWFTLGGYLFKTTDNIFKKIELLMILMVIICVAILFYIQRFPFWLGAAVSILLCQRVLEYLIVYSRNFILNHGRVFTHFPSRAGRGQWLILMFFLNVIQVIVIFAIWYRFLSLNIPNAFSQQLGILNSLYFSMVTFFTIGYGDITPIVSISKILTLVQMVIAFYTIVIVINGLISMHFQNPKS